MAKLIKDIRDTIDAHPGMPFREFAMRCYASDLFMVLVEHRKLIIFDTADRLGTVTEFDLLNGLWDWKLYSSYYHIFTCTENTCMQLYGRNPSKELERAELLEQAAQFILHTLC